MEIGDTVIHNEKGSHGTIKSIDSMNAIVLWSFSKTSSKVSVGTLTKIGEKK